MTHLHVGFENLQLLHCHPHCLPAGDELAQQWQLVIGHKLLPLHLMREKEGVRYYIDCLRNSLPQRRSKEQSGELEHSRHATQERTSEKRRSTNLLQHRARLLQPRLRLGLQRAEACSRARAQPLAGRQAGPVERGRSPLPSPGLPQPHGNPLPLQKVQPQGPVHLPPLASQ